ncbi:MAG: metallophosphoesterase [Haloarculaceae archaeon]
MRLGVISDTHDNVAAIEEAVDLFEREGIDTLVHCGDYVAPLMIPYFEGFELHGVLGNNDGDADAIERQFMDLGGDSRLHGRYAELTFDGTSLFVLHGDQGMDVVDEWAESGSYDYVLYGHFHAAEERDVGETTVVNPGAHLPITDDSRSVAVLDTRTDAVEFFDVEG